MKFTVKAQADALKESTSSYINSSGIYDATLNYVQVAQTKNGAYQLNFNLTHQGTDQTIYGPIIVNKDGSPNEITQDLVNRLCVIAGMADGQELETEEVVVKLGKEQKETEITIISGLTEIDLKIRVQMEYSLWNNEIQERKAIKAFYREDGASAAEAVSGENIGKRYNLDKEKYADNVTYRDGLTEEDVKAWIAQRTSGSSSSGSSKPADSPAPKRRPAFLAKG